MSAAFGYGLPHADTRPHRLLIVTEILGGDQAVLAVATAALGPVGGVLIAIFGVAKTALSAWDKGKKAIFIKGKHEAAQVHIRNYQYPACWQLLRMVAIW